MSRWDAARRGAATAVLWAAATCALLVCIGEWSVLTGRASRHLVLAYGLLYTMSGSGAFVVAAALVIVTTATGAAMGVFARGVQLEPLRRGVILAVAALPAVWVVVGATWALATLPLVIGRGPSAPFFLLVGALWFPAITILDVGSLAVIIPAVVAAFLLEGWTRPEMLVQSGLARPVIRRRVLLVLVTIATSLTTCAGFNWSRVVSRF